MKQDNLQNLRDTHHQLDLFFFQRQSCEFFLTVVQSCIAFFKFSIHSLK